MIRLGIIGSRHFTDGHAFHHSIRDGLRELGIPFDKADCHEDILVVTGDQRGVDTLAAAWAQNWDMLYVQFHAKAAARSMGAPAFAIRTRHVVDYCTHLIALPDQRTKSGTRNGIDRARERGIPVSVQEVSA